jgi:DNA polymerase III delta prime subunit
MSDTNNQWLSALLDDEIPRGRHVILHGNIYDSFLLDEPVSLRTALRRALEHAHYRVIVVYNVATGLTLVDDSMAGPLAELRQQVAAARSPNAGASTPANGSTPAPPGAPPPTVRTAAQRLGQVSGPPDPSRGSPEMALAEIASLLAQETTPIACIVEYADLLVQGAMQSKSEEAQRQLVWLEKAMQEASFVDVPSTKGGAPRRLRNMLVLLVGDIRNLQGALYGNNNPHVVPIHVGLPTEQVRAMTLSRSFFPRANGDDRELAPARQDAIQRLAQLTDGMPLWDVAALRRTSIKRGIEPTDAHRLVVVHRYGETDDPWQKLDSKRVLEAQANLDKVVFGQSAATRAVADLLVSAVAGINYESNASSLNRRPRGVFFFVGPTGVGKTELAKALAAFLFGADTAESFHRFDMSEYMHDHQVDRLAGSPPGYVGHGSGGELTNFVQQHPFSLLLFDEIEKAHQRVLDVFLQILDAGRLTDGQGRTAYFADTVVIFTSNVGSAQPAESKQAPLWPAWNNVPGSQARAATYAELREHYRLAVKGMCLSIGRPELWSRIGEDSVIVFEQLRPEHTKRIAAKLLAELRHSARNRHHVDLTWDDASIDIVNAEAVRAMADEGGRSVKPVIDRLIRFPLARWFLGLPEGSKLEGSTLRITTSTAGQIEFHLLSPPHASIDAGRAWRQRVGRLRR